GGGEVTAFEFKMQSLGGVVFDVECTGTAVRRRKSLVGLQVVLRDISERKKLESKLIRSYQSLGKAKAATILGLARLAEYRDLSTGKHLERMREYSKLLVEQLGKNPEYNGYITSQYIDDLYQSAILHDIGKVGVSDTILLKTGTLSPQEFNAIKLHTIYGRDILKEVDSEVEGQSFLSMGKTIAYSHHEKWDGSGYPDGLKRAQIPLSARCVALADVYDALTSSRIYKPPFSHEKAKQLILQQKGVHFASDVVESFVFCEEGFKNVLETFRSMS
ncbi:MAG: HD domain-containing phosphohydrolase, partial [Nitrospinota bacterium]